MTDILMPALSPTMTEGKLARWLKKPGDAIAPGDVIAEIETDKAMMEVEAIDEGMLGEIKVPEGTEGVAVNAVIATLVGGDESASPKKPTKAEASPPPSLPPQGAGLGGGEKPAAKPALNGHANRIIATPLARRLAKAAGIDMSAIKGSGPHGRIVKADVDKAAGPRAPRPAPAAAPPGAFKTVPHSSIRKTIARRLVEAKSTIPHFYLTVDMVIDDLLKLRKDINEKGGYKISVNDFVIKACAFALRKMPQVNASWSDEAMIVYENVDVSVAVATPDGLITPIIRNADQKSLSAISAEMKDLAQRAKDKKLKLDEFQGGGFSISNLGMYGIKDFSAIINPPQAAILAVGAGEQRPIVKNGALAVGSVMSCTLSCDHRVVDGATGAEFLQVLKPLIENPITMLV
jgi:pyruvate dehydrogenase E2 component (dihydrolipoamide acetyltransferase)